MRSIERAYDGSRRPSARTPGSSLSSAHSRRSAARLTRRGRVVVVLLTLVLLIVGGFTLGRVSSQAAGPTRPLPTVTVAPGETLWTIAARVAPSADQRVVVDEIEALNHLTGGRVQAGQQLRLPR